VSATPPSIAIAALVLGGQLCVSQQQLCAKFRPRAAAVVDFVNKFLSMSEAQREAVGRAMRPLEQPHEILGVPRNADEPTLRKSFRMMCKLLHPDKCHLEEAKTAFQRVGAAFEALLAKAQAGGANYAATTATTTTMTAPAPAPAQVAPAPATKAPKLSKGELNFTVRVAQAPSVVRNPARPPTRPPPSKPKPSAPSTVQQMDPAPREDDEEDEDDSSSEEEDDDEEDVSFAISARAGFADDDLGSDDDLIEHPEGIPPPGKKKAAGRRRSSGKGGNAAGGSRKVGAKKRRAHNDEFDDFIDDEEEEETRAEDAGARDHGEGSRRSGRNAKRRRVDYSVIEEYGVRAERQLRGAGPNEDSDAEGGSGAAAAAADPALDEAQHAWVPPLWFEYQSDSEDDEEEAERKRRLKARVLAGKRQAAQQVTRAVDGSDASQGSKVQAEASSKAWSRPATDGKAATAAAAEEEFTACFCGSDHEPEWWAQCSECERWCHGECTGHSQATVEQITYLCKPCAAADAAALGALDDDEEVGGPVPPPPAQGEAAATSTGAATGDGDDDLLDLLGD